METSCECGEKRAVVFDSGIGGLKLLYECYKIAPCVHYFFISDNGNVPYGNRTSEEILSLTLAALNGIEKLKPDALVVACNTVTAHCIDRLRARYSFPVVGIQPAIKQAVKAGEKCLVLATEATVKSPSFLSLINKFSTPETKVAGCKNLAAFIEKNVLNLPCDLPDGLLPMEEADCVVLGCTHYSFVKEQIERRYQCPVFDGFAGTAAHFLQILGTGDHFCTPTGNFDHLADKEPKVTFLRGDFVKNKLIFESLFAIKR